MRPVHYLGIFIPAAIALELAHASPLLVFSAAALGVIPCAAVMGEATEAIAAKSGPGIGGLLNVTFGNAPELIIAFFALIEGLQEVVKASSRQIFKGREKPGSSLIRASSAVGTASSSRRRSSSA